MTRKKSPFMLLLLFASVVFFSCGTLPPRGVPAEEFGMHRVAESDDSRPGDRTLDDAGTLDRNDEAVRRVNVSNATFVYRGVSFEEFSALCEAVGRTWSDNEDRIVSRVFSRQTASGTKFEAVPTDENLGPYYDEEKALGCQQLLSGVETDALGNEDLRSSLDDMNLSVEVLPQLFLAAAASLTASEPFSLSGYYIKLEYRGHNRDLIRSSYGSIRIAIKLDARTPVDVGGFESTTTGTGSFYFSGEPSLSRIIEGIVLIVDENGNRVEARENPKTGKWCVHVAGLKNGEPHEFDFEVEALNE